MGIVANDVAEPGKGTPSGKAKRQGRSTARARFGAIHKELRNRICLLVYPPGTMLGETELAKEFGVSRTPVRRVLSRLEFDGLVEIRHGVGTIVTTIDEAAMRDIYALRCKLAEMSGVLNPLPPAPGDIERMRGLLDRLRGHGDDLTPEQYWEINVALHVEICKRLGNGALRDVIDRLYYLTNRTWYANSWVMDWHDEIECFARELEDLIRCLEMADMEGFGLVRRNAVSFSHQRLQRYMARTAGGD